MSDSHFRQLKWVPLTGASMAGHHLTGFVPPPTSPMAAALMRVGLPTAPPPFDKSALTEAQYLLRAASEIEHGLLVQYLYAAYSSTDIGRAGAILRVAKQEMGHLISVVNLLVALKANPYFGRDDFPTAPSDGDEVFPFAMMLEPLSLDSIAKYVVAESPPLEQITDPAMKARVEPVLERIAQGVQQTVNHVGALYVALYWLFKPDDTRPSTAEWPAYPTDLVMHVHRDVLHRTDWHVKDDAFATAEFLNGIQADATESWGGSDAGPLFVRSVIFGADGHPARAHLLETLAKIAEQGEGWQLPPPGSPPSHFLQFLQIFEALRDLAAANQPLGVAQVPVAPTATPPTDPNKPPDGYIANAEANLWARVFNLRYQILLLKLSLVFLSSRDDEHGGLADRSALIDDAVSTEMRINLRGLARELVKMRRRGVKADGEQPLKAAPPFELPRNSLPEINEMNPLDARAAVVSALKTAMQNTRALAADLTKLPADLLDVPANRSLITETIDTSDEPLLAALG